MSRVPGGSDDWRLRSRAVVDCDQALPFGILVGRQLARVHLQGFGQFLHHGSVHRTLEFFALQFLVVPCFLGPLHEAHQLLRTIGRLVLAGKTQTFDFTFVRLAQLVDLLASDRIPTGNGSGEGVEAV